ncbi:MAG TPA: hypothetical protein VNJ70_00605 [Thermoanaerobaculia bacterium]|nr:hypothetical protein [Thermoanaerobaculia bacterium]
MRVVGGEVEALDTEGELDGVVVPEAAGGEGEAEEGGEGGYGDGGEAQPAVWRVQGATLR